MPISDHVGVNTEGYKRVDQLTHPESSSVEPALLPFRDSTIRFSAPYLPGTFPSSDTLRGFHLGGKMPQYRIPVPPMISAQGAGTASAVTFVSTSSSSSSTTVPGNPPLAQTASVTTPVIAPAGQFTGVVSMAKAFVVLSIAVNAAARVRLYGTASAQSTDLTRSILNGPGFGTEQNIIGDVVLDTAPVVWRAVDMVGANADGPQSTAAYITVDNISQASMAIQVSIVYVPIQS